ncbi:helix-turn-helix domain-containing protein [Asanoa sp. NPDC049573]|uniref:helix-turn-helix domain-containing protein n=1 Tax=Asanoa sp. NPDC049573 TaxID=3155396 RepID=UPI00343AD91D
MAIGGPSERADAARNRERVLAAAAELFASRGPQNVTMDDIAKAAGVGRATLYRRIQIARLDRGGVARRPRTCSAGGVALR